MKNPFNNFGLVIKKTSEMMSTKPKKEHELRNKVHPNLSVSLQNENTIIFVKFYDICHVLSFWWVSLDSGRSA